MTPENIKPISSESFRDYIRTSNSKQKPDLKEFFKSEIKLAGDFAISPFYWFIPDNSVPCTIAACPSFEQLTPFTVKELIENSENPDFFASNIHPEECNYVLGAIDLCMKTSEYYYSQKKAVPKFNIYCRMLDATSDFVWRLIQFPSLYFNEDGMAEGAFVMVSDLSHLPYVHKPMLTMLDTSNKLVQYYVFKESTMQLEAAKLPKISLRERDVLKLIVKGLNTPQIAEKLFISYNTVQNHKRNLREKTNCKTAAELIHFVIKNNLL